MAAQSLSIKDIGVNISKKPLLIEKSEFLSLGKDINLVGYDPMDIDITSLNKTFSPILLNWVEPYEIKGVNKTLFYTKVNSGLKVGDRVFIINGNYDSDLLIESDKYKKGRDGYKILYIDKCKIVLDIDYTGIKAYTEEEDDNFIKIYYIKDKNEFLHASRQTTTRGGKFEYKFDHYQNNISFIDYNYNPITNYWGLNAGVTGSPGLYVKNGTQSWTNITTQFDSGSYSVALSPTYTNNNRIKIIDGTFTHNGKEFKEGFVYKWNNGWEVDVTYFQPILSKNNFRDGNFKGVWNTGLFGKQNDQIEWEGDGSTWNNGTLLNTKWIKGTVDSVYTLSESYFSSFDSNGLPYQKINDDNNGGRGYNFIIDSNIEESSIINGSVYKTTIGQQSATYSVVEDEILNSNTNYKNTAQAYFDACIFRNSYVNKSELKNTRSNNSKIENSKSINSYFDDSVFKYSNYNSNNIIKILAYDELNASEYKQNGTFSNVLAQKVYKFYINKESYSRLKTGDKFYIKGLKINDNSKDLISFFDKKFQINSWINYDDYGITKTGYDYSVFLSTPGDNLYNFTSVTSSSNYYTSVLNSTNSNSIYYSIDLWVRTNDINNVQSIVNFNKDSTACPDTSIVEPNSLGNIIDITNAYIIDSDFNSGLFDNSDWNSGYHFNDNNDTNISNSSSFNYNLSINANNNIIATTSYNLNYSENIKVGSVLFLDSVDFISLTGSITRIPDSYKIISNDYELKEIGTNIISGLSSSIGTYSTIGAQNRYGHLKLLKITRSNIKSGIFRRPYITESLIKDINYDSFDKDYLNLDKIKNLLIVDSIFSDKLNTLSLATYLYSFFLNGSDLWDNGIVQNSIWNGSTFSNGVIKESRWVGGIFTGGYFYNSRTFNGSGTNSYAENISSYYKDGNTTYNNRYSWQNGTFINGNFYKSDWENGTFSYGNFYNSKWYDGNFENGTIGNNQISVSDTKFYNGTVSYAIVDNATIYAEGNNGLVNNNINWLDGIFINGVFGAANTSTNSATWHNGIFNGGQFTDNGKWKNGTFNSGKFLSSYGYTQSDSLTQSDFGWENGIFNNGEFGNANGLTNSIWYTGQFNDGIFKGRLWNDGIFLYGEFQGSGASPVGGTYGTTYSNASLFVESFTNSYWGKWRNGIFTETKDKYVKDVKLFTVPTKASNTKQTNKSAKFKYGLWENGTFSHSNGEMYSSVWLNGVFERGKFNNSSFNPYVLRGLTYSFNLNDSTCYWANGELNESDFFISNWYNGKFIMGTASGAIWKNGIVEYMNAFNLFWENGLWRNGNWYGSSFEFDGIITDDYTNQILKRGMSWSYGTSSCHVWNIFQDNNNQNISLPSYGIEATITPSINDLLYTGEVISNVGIDKKKIN